MTLPTKCTHKPTSLPVFGSVKNLKEKKTYQFREVTSGVRKKMLQERRRQTEFHAANTGGALGTSHTQHESLESETTLQCKFPHLLYICPYTPFNIFWRELRTIVDPTNRPTTQGALRSRPQAPPRGSCFPNGTWRRDKSFLAVWSSRRTGGE